MNLNTKNVEATMSDKKHPQYTPRDEYNRVYQRGYMAGTRKCTSNLKKLYNIFTRHAFRLVQHLDSADRDLLKMLEKQFIVGHKEDKKEELKQ